MALESLGFRFNNRGELRTIKDDDPFVFSTQKVYDELGEAMTEWLYEEMERHRMERTELREPDDTSEGPHSFVFATKRFQKKDTLLLLVQGSGAVRAGQWGRRLILNENLDQGSMLPYIDRAHANGWGVIVANPHQTGKSSPSPDAHCRLILELLVRPASASRILAVAHSAGYYYLGDALSSLPDSRLRFVAFTDTPQANVERWRRDNMQLVSANWNCGSRASADAPIQIGRHSYALYAGTHQHDRSSAAALAAVFHVLERNPHEGNIKQLLTEAIRVGRGEEVHSPKFVPATHKEPVGPVRSFLRGAVDWYCWFSVA